MRFPRDGNASGKFVGRPIGVEAQRVQRQFLSIVRFLSSAAFWLAVANVVLLLLIGHYDVRLGAIHLVAHGLFKPLQLAAGAFWIWLALRARSGGVPDLVETKGLTPIWLLAIFVSAALVVHGPFVTVNFQNPFWTHLESSMELTSWSAVGNLFTKPQSDGFYRPLTFLSLFADYKIFDLYWPAYHFQSIALHIANVILVCYLASDLGLGRKASRAAALLFSVAPLTFEAVLWPAARFDLWATLFILLTLRATIRILRDEQSGYLRWLSAGGLYLLALLNKESAYCVPLLVLFLVVTRKIWGIDQIKRRNAIGLIALFGMLTAAMLLSRVALYHSLGGYATPVGRSAHVHIAFKTIESLFTRVFAIGLFTANLSTGIFSSLGIGLFLFVTVLAVILVSGVKLQSVELSLLALAFIAALPTLNIIGWIGVNAQQSRYLYLPGVWLMLLFARLIYKTNWPAMTVALMLTANGLITYSDLSIYKDMLKRTKSLAGEISTKVTEPNIKQIVILNLPPEANGIFFFRDELSRRIVESLPEEEVAFDAPVVRDQSALWFRWIPDARTLAQVQPGIRRVR